MKVNFFATLRQVTGQKTVEFDLPDGVTAQGVLDAVLDPEEVSVFAEVVAGDGDAHVRAGGGMQGTPAFGKGVGGGSVVIGIVGVVAGIVLLVDPGSSIAVVIGLSLIVVHIAGGWKVYRLSRAPR